MNKRHWQPRAVCPKCGWHCYAPFADLFHVRIECCPKCGTDKSEGSWAIEIMRLIEVAPRNYSHWKPWTWWHRDVWEQRK